MSHKEITKPYEVGALYRRSFRKELMFAGLTVNEDYVEHKSLLISTFSVRANNLVHEELTSLINYWLHLQD